MTYDERTVADYFDALGDREWDRLETSLQGRIKYAVHQRLIAQQVLPGMRVLDVGAGPGRFALDIVEREPASPSSIYHRFSSIWPESDCPHAAHSTSAVDFTGWTCST